MIILQVGEEKFVEFNEYCKKCEYRDLSERDDPCFDCLDEPVNVYTHRPINFKEREYFTTYYEPITLS